MIERVKRALEISTDAFDDELNELIEMALADLKFTNIDENKLDQADMNINRAVITYCKMNFSNIDEQVYNRLERSYIEQKAQMQISSKYNGG